MPRYIIIHILDINNHNHPQSNIFNGWYCLFQNILRRPFVSSSILKNRTNNKYRRVIHQARLPLFSSIMQLFEI